MGKIDSPLGSRDFQSSNQPRTFTVGDESMEVENQNQQRRTRHAQPEQEQPVRGSADAIARRQELLSQAAQQPQGNGGGSVSSAARRRIDMLVGLGRAYKEVEVQDNDGTVVFSLRTLKGREMRRLAELTQQISQAQVAGAIYDIRNVVLAYAIYAVGGIDIDSVLECRGEDPEVILDMRKSFIEDLDEAVLNMLYAKYQELSNENSVRFGVGGSKVEEVVEDLKKSGEGDGSNVPV